MVNGKKVNEIFVGDTSLIPEKMRSDLNKFLEQSKKDGLIYVTDVNESIANSFSKKELVEILRNRDLPISGNKIELVNRIELNGGLEELHKNGKVSHCIKLTDSGKLEIKAYLTNFKKEYDEFQQYIYNLFLLKDVSSACENIDLFKDSYPFEKSEFFMSFSGKELYDLCKTIRYNNVLEIIGIQKEYRDAILSILCMYHSFGDFNLEEKIEEIYDGFKDLLVNSEFITIKDLPFIEFNDMIRGYPTEMTRNDNRFYKIF